MSGFKDVWVCNRCGLTERNRPSLHTCPVTAVVRRLSRPPGFSVAEATALRRLVSEWSARADR